MKNILGIIPAILYIIIAVAIFIGVALLLADLKDPQGPTNVSLCCLIGIAAGFYGLYQLTDFSEE